jgi:hypothetical protein
MYSAMVDAITPSHGGFRLDSGPLNAPLRRATPDPKPHNDSALKRRVAAMRSAIRSDLNQGNITFALQESGTPHLAICLRRSPEFGFFNRAGRGLEQFLKHSRTTVTLQIETPTQPQLEQLLRLLARYGDRVSIAVDERLRAMVPIDSSVFRLVLVGPEST